MKKVNVTANSIILVATSIFLQSFSFLSIKISTLQSSSYAFLWLILAFVFIGLRAVIWQMLLRISELSKVYPYASLVQVLIFIYAIWFFDEQFTYSNLLGLLIMLTGIHIISKGSTA